MTVLIDQARGAKTIHVLIVGVGRHEEDVLESLSGLGESVGRLYDWWRLKAPGRCLDGWSIGSVAVLASGEESIALVDGAGRSVAPQEPTYENVDQSLQSWLDRARDGGMGYLHWCGHGAMQGLDAGLGLQALFCQDLAHDGEPKGLDWRATEDGLNGLCGDSQITCFIDACRTPPESRTGRRYDCPFGNYSLRPEKVAIHHSAVKGAVAVSFRKPIPAAGFLGGPVGTEAQLSALDRYGAFERNDGRGWAVNTISLAEGIHNRMQRIGGHIPGLGSGWSPPSVGPFPAWAWDPLLAMPDPHALMDIEVPSGRDIGDLSCTVTHCTSRAPMPVEQSGNRFESSVPYGDYEILIVDKSAPSEPPVHRERLPARLRLHRVRIEGGHP